MHHPAYLVGVLFAQDAQSVLADVPRMDDQRLTALARGLDVRTKARSLPLELALLAIVIQSGLADGNDFRVLRALDQILGPGTGIPGLIGMHADRSEKL